LASRRVLRAEFGHLHEALELPRVHAGIVAGHADSLWLPVPAWR
jgi:hypothetical protein